MSPPCPNEPGYESCYCENKTRENTAHNRAAARRLHACQVMKIQEQRDKRHRSYRYARQETRNKTYNNSRAHRESPIALILNLLHRAIISTESQLDAFQFVRSGTALDWDWASGSLVVIS